MTTLAVSAVQFRHRSAFEWPGLTAQCPAETISGPALIIMTMPRPGGTAQTPARRQAMEEARLLTRKADLVLSARKLRDQRRCKAASACEAELQGVTLQLLAQGAR